MRVDFVAEQVCSRVPGGTGRYAAQLLAALGRLDRRTGGEDALRVRAITGRACPSVESLVDDVATLGLPGPLLARLWERGLGPRVGSRADLVHAPTLLLPPVRHARLVVTIHDVVPWTHPATLTPRGVAFHQRMGHRAAQAADLIITPTEQVAAQVSEVLEPAGRVRAIPLGVSPLPTPDDAQERRAHLGIGARPYVLFVGTHEPRKGLDVLIEAMSLPDVRDLDLVIAGSPGWGGIDPHAMAHAVGLADRVTVVGPVPDATLAALYASAAALALPSRAEGFGIPVIEAMSHSVPVVISEDPALMETSAGLAHTAPIGDADSLARALALATSDSAEVRALVAAGRDHAGTMTWESAAQRTLEAYATTLHG